MNEQLKIIISAEIGKLKENVNKAKSEIQGFKDKVKEASKNVDEKFKGMGASMANGIKAASVAVAAVGAALIGLGASTEEYRISQAKLATAFESAGSSAAVAKDTYNDLYRTLGDGDKATEAASHLAKLTTEEKALNEWTTICQGVYATFGDSLPIEGLTEAANETAKVGTVTGTLADALNWAGVSEDAFNESLAACNTEAEREALIRETLSGLYDDAAAKYEENNAQVLAQNEAQAKLQNTLATLGEAVAPVITLFTNLANDALSKVVPHIKDLGEKYMPVLQEALDKAGKIISNIFKYISENWELLATLGGIIGGIAAAIGLYNAVAAIKAAMAALEVTTVWGLVAAYAAQAAAMIVAIAPYVLIVAAIAAVIAIIVLCVKHWDEIKEAIKKAMQAIVDAVKAGIDWVVNLFNKIINFVKENWQALLLMLVNPFAGAFKLLYDNCGSFRTYIDNFVAKIKSVISAGFSWIKEKIVNPIKDAFTSVKQTFSNIVSTIGEKLGAAKEKVRSIIDAIKGFFKFEWSLPKLKVPKFAITPSGWSIGDLLKGSIPKLSVNWNALGGVFDKPTVFGYGDSLQGIGENGAEAVVPLENNTEWLDKMATMLANKLGVGAPVVMQVDGKTFGEVSVNSINAITRQTGNLPLVIA